MKLGKKEYFQYFDYMRQLTTDQSKYRRTLRDKVKTEEFEQIDKIADELLKEEK